MAFVICRPVGQEFSYFRRVSEVSCLEPCLRKPLELRSLAALAMKHVLGPTSVTSGP